MMDTNSILFESDRNIIGVSQIDDSTILITDEIRVLKYEVDSRRVLQEWRTETGCKFLSSAAICKDNRYYATIDVHTIAAWKNSSMYISERCKKIKISKSCLGLVEHMGHIFAVHHDGSLSLFGDTKKWCHTFSKDMSILSFNKVAKSHGCCDVILVVSEGLEKKVAKYAVQIQDQEVNVNIDGFLDCHSLLSKFAMVKSMKVLFLDELQSVVYGILEETKTEGVYLLNERNESVKLLMQFESHSCGEMVQLIRRQDSILFVTSKQILEMNVKYKLPFLCNLINENQNADCSDENMMECESTCNDDSFDKFCKNAKAWLQSKGKSLSSLDSSSQEDQKNLQECFSTRFFLSPAKKVTTSEKLYLVPLLCAYPFDLSAKLFVEMTSFILSLNDDMKYKENVPILLNHIVESTIPDDMLKSLSTMAFTHVKILLEHLYDELLEGKLDTEKVVDWINMLLDSHHTHIMVSKDWEIISLIKQLVDSLCEEAKEDSTKRFMEKLKFGRLQKRAKSRRGCYVEMFEL